VSAIFAAAECCMHAFVGSRILSIGDIPKDQLYPLKYPFYFIPSLQLYYYH